MKKSTIYQLLVVSIVWLTSCQSEKATFYFSSRPVSVAIPVPVGPIPTTQASLLAPTPPAPQALPAYPQKQVANRTPKRLTAIAQVAAAPLAAARNSLSRPNTMRHASKRHLAPKEGGAKAFEAIMQLLAVVALLLGAGLIIAGLASSSVGVGGIILGAILFVAGLVVSIST
ncbi:hypothetical protein K3G63_13155 [Hymenobacter sp. HSC-4F20]|uniref:hypothetical protein n=1 Tax=Hymenobacter sp. HSC-4F20 TaxID=2864135 RepID=UPI001C73102D|nr:hypothetical protein [Hymenobacter sp. HSC-4F20]MBX0291393.1 hypothetical protein [Hymenobacter sp. HSC-4F20]